MQAPDSVSSRPAAGTGERSRRSKRLVISMIGSPMRQQSDGAARTPSRAAELVDQTVNEAEAHPPTRPPQQQRDSERVTLFESPPRCRSTETGVVPGGSHAAGAGRCRGLELDQQLARGLPPIRRDASRGSA
jgi:hypothetical protein